MMGISKNLIKKCKRLLRRNRALLTSTSFIFALPAVILLAGMNDEITIDQKSYRPTLDLIAEAESNGNYNAYFGNSTNTKLKLTEMTIAEVLEWQEQYVADGSPSSAAGRYQILNTTLRGITADHGISHEEKYDEAMQDKLAIHLIERRGSIEYVKDEISREEFAANLAKEWAGLPRVLGANPDASYYAGDGLNKAHIDVPSLLAVVQEIRLAD